MFLRDIIREREWQSSLSRVGPRIVNRCVCVRLCRPPTTRQSFSAKATFFWTTVTSAVASPLYWSTPSQAPKRSSATPRSGTTTVSQRVERIECYDRTLAFLAIPRLVVRATRCGCCHSKRCRPCMSPRRTLYTEQCRVRAPECDVVFEHPPTLPLLSSRVRCACHILTCPH